MSLTIARIVKSNLCCGCGACSGFAPQVLEMEDVPEAGRRPRMRDGVTVGKELQEAVAVCPGISLQHDYDRSEAGLIRELESAWGPVLGLWEGHCSDPEIRFAGSSGGGVTAIALYMLSRGDIHGVVHTAARSDKPYLNETVLSRSREELLSRTGSRYAPASPADSIPMIKAAPRPCVFIGKPCDVAAMQKARRLDAQLDRNLALTIGFFCAGAPSTNGTLALLKRMGIGDPDRLVSLRYRGNGWPGRATAVLRNDDGTEESRQMTYEQSWGEVLTRHVQWRCRICPDHTGEFADISVGDPWYRKPLPGEQGDSLLLGRTRLGLNIINSAIANGFLRAEPREPSILPASQPNLYNVRAQVWGRVVGSRLVGAMAPQFRRMQLFQLWSQLSLRQKFQSLYGTSKRLLLRRWRGR